MPSCGRFTNCFSQAISPSCKAGASSRRRRQGRRHSRPRTSPVLVHVEGLRRSALRASRAAPAAMRRHAPSSEAIGVHLGVVGVSPSRSTGIESCRRLPCRDPRRRPRVSSLTLVSSSSARVVVPQAYARRPLTSSAKPAAGSIPSGRAPCPTRHRGRDTRGASTVHAQTTRAAPCRPRPRCRPTGLPSVFFTGTRSVRTPRAFRKSPRTATLRA